MCTPRDSRCAVLLWVAWSLRDHVFFSLLQATTAQVTNPCRLRKFQYPKRNTVAIAPPTDKAGGALFFAATGKSLLSGGTGLPQGGLQPPWGKPVQIPTILGGPLGKRSIHNFYAIPFSKPPNIPFAVVCLSFMAIGFAADHATRYSLLGQSWRPLRCRHATQQLQFLRHPTVFPSPFVVSVVGWYGPLGTMCFSAA